jgi:phosphonate degradation associated HDIG domain protein
VPSSSPSDVVAGVFRLFNDHGSDFYQGEQVSQTEHGLQAALAAENEGASTSLIVAALLHDVGHLLHNIPENLAGREIDDHHEELGYRWLRRHFGPAVTEPVRLHVEAKRYLCAVVSGYHGGLSAASIASLALQGGPMSEAEVAAFRTNPFYQDAIRLRRWDDTAKIVGLNTFTLEHYRKAIEENVIVDKES